MGATYPYRWLSFGLSPHNWASAKTLHPFDSYCWHGAASRGITLFAIPTCATRKFKRIRPWRWPTRRNGIPHSHSFTLPCLRSSSPLVVADATSQTKIRWMRWGTIVTQRNNVIRRRFLEGRNFLVANLADTTELPVQVPANNGASWPAASRVSHHATSFPQPRHLCRLDR